MVLACGAKKAARSSSFSRRSTQGHAVVKEPRRPPDGPTVGSAAGRLTPSIGNSRQRRRPHRWRWRHRARRLRPRKNSSIATSRRARSPISRELSVVDRTCERDARLGEHDDVGRRWTDHRLRRRKELGLRIERRVRQAHAHHADDTRARSTVSRGRVQQAYSTKTGAIASERTGWSATDLGRFLLSLKILATRDPQLPRKPNALRAAMTSRRS